MVFLHPFITPLGRVLEIHSELMHTCNYGVRGGHPTAVTGPSWRYPARRSHPKYELTACLFALCGERCVTGLAADLCVGWAEKKGSCLWVSVRVNRDIVHEAGWGDFVLLLSSISFVP